MPIKPAINTLIRGDAPVQALISGRLYPNVIPQTVALPAVAYQEISTNPDYRHDGQCDVVGTLVQLTIEADSAKSADTVAAALRALLSGFKGTVGTVQIGGIFLENQYDGYSEATEVTTLRQDYMIFWKEG